MCPLPGAAVATGVDVRSVLIVDEHEPFLAGLGTSFRQLGREVWIESTPAGAAGVVRTALPDLIVFDLPASDRAVVDLIPELRRINPSCLIAVVTVRPSIAAATALTRQGVDAYLSKPVSASLILSALAGCESVELKDQAALPWPSLDRTIWDFLNQTALASSTIAEAARRLRLERRSLRRMLDKAAPPR